MNKLGDVTKGDVIGKRSKEYFVWTACPNCGVERWVRQGKTELQTYTGWCQTCSARRNNKMRTYRTADNSLGWKGGRTVDHGYILVLLQPDDFFYPMAKHDHYVREHRLVMAKHLNRCLLPWEVVHHKGIKYALGSVENKQDNRIDNLELLGSNAKHNKEVERLIKQARNEGFKAGRASRKEEIEELMDYAFKDGERIGAGKVVGFIKSERKCKYINDVFYYPVYEKALEAKLEEWEIANAEK